MVHHISAIGNFGSFQSANYWLCTNFNNL